MDTKTGCKVHEVFFPGGNRRPVEIKDLSLSSEDEVKQSWREGEGERGEAGGTFLS
jgi:hypothetical protein